MSTPRYVAKRVGDEFKLVRQDPGECAVCFASVIGGGMLAWMGLRRRSLPGLIVSALGGSLVYRGLTGDNPFRTWMGTGAAAGPESSPSYQHDWDRRAEQAPEDEVDEASMESFPASDPPASAKAGTGG